MRRCGAPCRPAEAPTCGPATPTAPPQPPVRSGPGEPPASLLAHTTNRGHEPSEQRPVQPPGGTQGSSSGVQAAGREVNHQRRSEPSAPFISESQHRRASCLLDLVSTDLQLKLVAAMAEPPRSGPPGLPLLCSLSLPGCARSCVCFSL